MPGTMEVELQGLGLTPKMLSSQLGDGNPRGVLGLHAAASDTMQGFARPAVHSLHVCMKALVEGIGL